MSTKLTLTLDKSVIEMAKTHAANTGTSLSKLVENYLMAVSRKPVQEISELTPIVKSLKGKFKSSEGQDYREELSQILSEKYL